MPARKTTRKSAPPADQLPVYFSHSYRYEDRQLNEFFWDLFWDAGFTFSIDPKSKVMSHPYLQALVKKTSGFAAAITYRQEQENYFCSPFMLYEYGLALLARKPKLVFFDKRLSQRYFPERDPDLHEFDREHLEEKRDEFSALIRAFKLRAEPYRRFSLQRKGNFGVLLNPRHPAYTPDLLAKIDALITRINFIPDPAKTADLDSVQVAVNFDQYDFVILDVSPGVLPEWVHPYVHGRLIPSIRLFHTSEDRPAVLPEFVQSQFMRGIALEDEPVVFWREPEQLIAKLETHFKKIQSLDQPAGGRSDFEDRESGLRYFRGAGRRRKLRVFLSNASDANSLAQPLSRELQAHGIDAFHYIESNPIPLGSPWEPGLVTEARNSEIFVLLLSTLYPKSKTCMEEMAIALQRAAQGKATVIPYLLDPHVDLKSLPQGRNLIDRTRDEQIAVILNDVDELLRTEAIANVTPPPDDSKPVDIAFLTILKEEYEAVLRYLENSRPAPARPGSATGYPSSLGEITSRTYSSGYRVVLTFAGEAGLPNAVSATRDTIERWKPRYVVLVGIAGGVANDLAKGDVVVAKVVWNYEYGKVADGFTPRHDYTYTTDASIANAAEILALEEPDWSSRMTAKLPDGVSSLPSVKIGAVASGDKVVDNLADPFFQAVLKEWPKLLAVEMEGAGVALAIRKAVEEGNNVGFGMIRGISDTPGNTTVAAAQTQERDAWKKYASDAAACLAVHLVQRRWPVTPRESS